jgi:hypothetical protein
MRKEPHPPTSLWFQRATWHTNRMQSRGGCFRKNVSSKRRFRQCLKMKNMLRCLGGPPSSKDCRLGCFHLGGRGTVSMYAGYDATIPFCFIWLFSFKRERICWRSLRQTTFSSEDWRISSCREDCPSVMFFFGLLVSPILSDLGGSPSLFCLVFWANKSSPYIISIILSSLSSVLFF